MHGRLHYSIIPVLNFPTPMAQESISSPPFPTAESARRAIPTLEIPNHTVAIDLKKSLFSPTALILSPTFRPSRFVPFACLFAVTFLLCTAVFVLANPHIHSSKWFRTILDRRPQLPSYFPDLIYDSGYKITPMNARNVGNMKSEGKGELGFGKGEGKEKGESRAKTKERAWLGMMSKCDVFDGKWMKTDSPPLYESGSCPTMDESFNCFRNGRPDKGYEMYRWKPRHCSIPRLKGWKMLRLIRGKRMVYVGDSLNRNMWESMVCLLRNSVEDKSRVLEASGNTEFKKEGAYSFIFLDYNCSVEYIRSAFLVQEWEMTLSNGSKKETLRLDMADTSYETIKDADVLIFNTGNWWTHEKTSKGKGYYQEGDHVHEQLSVEEAFGKAMVTWGRWVEANIDTNKTHVFFRGYSFSHFSKGEWNTGGRCDDKEPIEDEKELLSIDELSPSIPRMLDKAMENVRIPVYYQNISLMTNYRGDAHPSLYRKSNMTEEEKHEFATHQDCSHWCLPGIPDTWNELLFVQLLFIHKLRRWQQQYGNTTEVHL